MTWIFVINWNTLSGNLQFRTEKPFLMNFNSSLILFFCSKYANKKVRVPSVVTALSLKLWDYNIILLPLRKSFKCIQFLKIWKQGGLIFFLSIFYFEMYGSNSLHTQLSSILQFYWIFLLNFFFPFEIPSLVYHFTHK